MADVFTGSFIARPPLETGLSQYWLAPVWEHKQMSSRRHEERDEPARDWSAHR
jgi:hypothetical protein